MDILKNNNMLELPGNIKEQKMQVYDRATLLDWVRQHDGKDIVLSVKTKRKTRSNKQNAYYHGVVVPMVREAINKFGNEFTIEETHEFLKAKFNAREIEVVADNFVEVPQSTSRLDTAEFMSYIEAIQRFASAMLGVYIPSPNEQMVIDFYSKQEDDGSN